MVRARSRWRRRAACALATCVASSGCSLILVHGPPDGYREMESFTCTEGDAIPILDVLWATANGLAAANAWLDTTTPDRGEIMLLGSSMALVSGFSAAVGFRRRSACREARVEMSRLRQTREPTDTGGAAPTPLVRAGPTTWWPSLSPPELPPASPSR